MKFNLGNTFLTTSPLNFAFKIKWTHSIKNKQKKSNTIKSVLNTDPLNLPAEIRQHHLTLTWSNKLGDNFPNNLNMSMYEDH